MGLDMFLYRRHYVQQWDHDPPERRFVVYVIRGGEPYSDVIKPERVVYVTEQIGYWRKANQIHKWFVDNVQGGADDCGEYQVTREQLKTLFAVAQAVLDKPDHAKTLLPTQDGFFFGDTDYDAWYFENVKNTAEILREVLNEPDVPFADYVYHASW